MKIDQCTDDPVGVQVRPEKAASIAVTGVEVVKEQEPVIDVKSLIEAGMTIIHQKDEATERIKAPKTAAIVAIVATKGDLNVGVAAPEFDMNGVRESPATKSQKHHLPERGVAAEAGAEIDVAMTIPQKGILKVGKMNGHVHRSIFFCLYRWSKNYSSPKLNALSDKLRYSLLCKILAWSPPAAPIATWNGRR